MCEISYILVQRSRFSGQKQWATFQISDVYLDPEETTCENVKCKQILICNKASIFVCSDVKYQKSSCVGHGAVTINIGQPFKFAVSNSVSIADFCKRSELSVTQWAYWTDIADFVPIPKQFWFTLAQSYREVAIVNQDLIVLGKKSARSSPPCPSRHCLFQVRLQNWAFWAELDAVNLKDCWLFSGTEPWPLHRCLL